MCQALGQALGMQADRGLGLAWKQLMSNVGGRNILTVVQYVKFNTGKKRLPRWLRC